MTKFISIMFIILILNLAAYTAHAASSVPVMVGGEADLDACGAVAEVHGLNPHGDGFLAVRAGPGTGYRILDRLYNGTQVYLCAKHKEWVGIVYGKPDQDCGVSSPLFQRQIYNGPCQSGWAHRKWLELIAG